MNVVSDERHLAYFDIFKYSRGQVNLSHIYPRTLVGWHRHEQQIDEWFVANGVLKVGTFDGKEVKFQVLQAGDYIDIPMGVWHGYYALTETILIYYCTQKYNPDDEFRTEIGSFGENWEVVAK